MLSFYPEFEAEPMANIEYLFLLDVSCSMKASLIARLFYFFEIHFIITFFVHNKNFDVIGT